MLFIIRQLRRSFFQPGKLRTYIAYALGEVILIVIGILIAVQIGEWREGLKNRIVERELLISINQNLEEETRSIVGDIADLKNQIEAMDMIIAYFDSDGIPPEEMDQFFGQFMGYNILESIHTAYETAKGAGLSISNTDLNRRIFRYYEMEQLEMHEYNAAVKERFESHVIPFAKEHFKEFGFKTIGVPKDINDPKFREDLLGLIVVLDVLLRETQQVYEKLLVSNQELIEAIEFELENF